MMDEKLYNTFVFMFSGQGSQYYQMGKELFMNNIIFKNELLKLDSVAYSILGESIVNRIYDSSKRKYEDFSDITYTHPAIFMTSYAFARALMEDGIYPNYLLGMSLGEISAAAVAGLIDVKDALYIIIKQTRIYTEYCKRGGMIAILGNLELFYNTKEINENSELAAINCNSHFVVSGNIEGISQVEKYLRNKNIAFQKLPVTFGFHSSHIDTAEAKYKELVKHININSPNVGILSCAKGDIVYQAEYDYFWQAVHCRIDFPKTIARLEAAAGNCVYIDVGFSGTLANFTKYNLDRESKSEVFSPITQFGCNTKILNHLKSLI